MLNKNRDRFGRHITLCCSSIKWDKLPETFDEGNIGYGDRTYGAKTTVERMGKKMRISKGNQGGAISCSTKLGVDCWFL